MTIDATMVGRSYAAAESYQLLTYVEEHNHAWRAKALSILGDAWVRKGDTPAAIDALAPPPIARTKSETELAPRRASCAFSAGAWPAATVSHST